MWKCPKGCKMHFVHVDRIYKGREDLVFVADDKELKNCTESKSDEIIEEYGRSEPYCGICGKEVIWEDE